MNRIARVFTRKTAASPTDSMAFFGAPTIENIADCIKAEVEAVHISTTFTWDIPRAEDLYYAWQIIGVPVEVGGPAFDDRMGDFTPKTVKLALCAKHMVDLETLNNTPISRLVAIAEADKDGRVIVLPCKVGDTIWRLKRTFETYPDKSKPYTEADGFLLQDIWNVGKNVFLTREEAEKALAELEGKKDG